MNSGDNKPEVIAINGMHARLSVALSLAHARLALSDIKLFDKKNVAETEIVEDVKEIKINLSHLIDEQAYYDMGKNQRNRFYDFPQKRKKKKYK